MSINMSCIAHRYRLSLQENKTEDKEPSEGQDTQNKNQKEANR